RSVSVEARPGWWLYRARSSFVSLLSVYSFFGWFASSSLFPAATLVVAFRLCGMSGIIEYSRLRTPPFTRCCIKSNCTHCGR
ncbi:hypothetical protein L195_g006476, partial [Trifolium pratense]